MKKTLLLLTFIGFQLQFFAQCNQLFISEYVEGYSNNKAIEIYNPTSNVINLSDYSLARFSNGSTTLGNAKIISLPNDMIMPNGTYVIVVDLTDTADWNSQFDKPAWNGLNIIDTVYDDVTGLPVVDADGNVLVGPQYNDDGAAMFGDVYTEKYDIQCKADAFICPDYDVNNVMYFNGNDAMALIEGDELLPDASNLLDVVGVIGEDPQNTINEPAWVDADGFWLTRDRSLVRQADIEIGRFATNEVVAQLGGTFDGEGWDSYSKNNFEYLGIHNSVCNTTQTFDRTSCSTGPYASNFTLNKIAFSMFPNPNNIGELYINAEESIESVEIFNLLGQNVLRIDGERQMITQVNIAGLEKGMYIVKLAFDKQNISTQKLIKE